MGLDPRLPGRRQLGLRHRGSPQLFDDSGLHGRRRDQGQAAAAGQLLDILARCTPSMTTARLLQTRLFPDPLQARSADGTALGTKLGNQQLARLFARDRGRQPPQHAGSDHQVTGHALRLGRHPAVELALPRSTVPIRRTPAPVQVGWPGHVGGNGRQGVPSTQPACMSLLRASQDADSFMCASFHLSPTLRWQARLEPASQGGQGRRRRRGGARCAHARSTSLLALVVDPLTDKDRAP